MATAQVNQLPNYLKAKTPRGLRLLCIKNNAKLSSTIQYFDIQFVKGYWYAWYYEPLTAEGINDLIEEH